MLVEVFRKNFLAAIVPVIVNAILNSHHVIVDIVAFVSKGDFPRSRLGEKQRGKILASWVTRKLRTIAQFGIRDPESIVPDDASTGRRISSISSNQQHSMSMSALQTRNSMPRSSTQTFNNEYISELPAQRYTESIPELPGQEFEPGDDTTLNVGGTYDSRSDDTPTEARPPGSEHQATWSNHSRQVSEELGYALDYSPIDQRGPFSNDMNLEGFNGKEPAIPGNVHELPLSLQPGADNIEYPPTDDLTPTINYKSKPFPSHEAEGKEAYIPTQESYDGSGYGNGHSDLQQQQHERNTSHYSLGDEEWKKEAGMYMNFTGSGPGSLDYSNR